MEGAKMKEPEATIHFKTSVRSVSETLISIIFPTVISILSMEKSMSQLHQENKRTYSIAVSGSIVITFLSSNFGLMSRLCVSEVLIEKWAINIYKVSKQLIFVSSALLMVLSFLLLLLFDPVHKQKIIIMVFILIVFELPIIVLIGHAFFLGKETPDPIDHKLTKSLEPLLALANGVALLFFSGMAGRVFQKFNNLTDNTGDTGDTFDGSLWSLYFGSLFCVDNMVANFAIPGIFPEKVNYLRTSNYVLVFLVTTAVLASSFKLVHFYIFWMLVPPVVTFYTGLLTMIFDNENIDSDEDEHQPVSISLTNLAFTGLLSALGYNGKYSQSLSHKTFAFLMSSALVSSLFWRVVTHDPPTTLAIVKAEKTLACFTLLLVFFATIASLVLAFQAL